MMDKMRWGLVAVPVWLAACGGGLNQTSITCPKGRTLLDGVCVSEPVADYVACVRSQGAQLGTEKGEKLSAEAGYLGVKAGAAAEVSESLEKKYSTSDEAMMAIVAACNRASGMAGPAVAETPVDPGDAGPKLLGHWKLDEQAGTAASDSSGNGNTGVLHGPPAWAAGRVGGAMRFVDPQWITVPESASLHSPTGVTLVGWFLANQTTDPDQPWRLIMLKFDPPDCEGTAVNCDNREYGVWLHVEQRFLHMMGTTEARVGIGQDACNTANGSIEFGKWYHFATVVSPKSRSIRGYLNGALVATCPMSEASLRRTSGPLEIGGRGPRTTWPGLLDDLRIYGEALTDQQVMELATAP